MSHNGNKIICRQCKAEIPIDADSCPECGKETRSDTPFLIGAALGLLLAVAAVFNPGDLLAYGVLGVLVAASSGYMIYRKRQRIVDDGGGEVV